MDAKIEGTASEYSSPAIDAFWTMSVNMWQMDVRTSGLLGWAAITPVERKRRGRGERRRETERDGERRRETERGVNSFNRLPPHNTPHNGL